MYNKLQYISQGNTIEEQLLNIHNALDNGCDWIQLRFKNGSQHELHSLAERVKIICDVYLASYIINDNVHLAQELDADGVHLGLSDMNTKEARAILGKTKIIGGTANTFDDVVIQVKNGCDYIGLGPYKYTKTKENLSPVLGLAGYHSIIKRITDQNIEIPIFAIGGIELKNIDNLMKTGIYGIAVSGLITQSEDPFQLITQINNNLYGNIIV
jgi:thiamine-phosphate pyrophosphorylase